MSPFTDEEKNLLMNQLRAFQHALIDDEVVLVEAVRKSDRSHCMVACIRQEVLLPPKIMGGQPTVTEQMIPILEFIDPRKTENPYEAMDEALVQLQDTGIVGADGSTIQRVVKK